MGMPEYDYGEESEEELPERGVADITEVEKYEFIQLILQGYDRREAALALRYKARPWRSLTSTLSPFYDEEFTNAYGEAKGSPEAKMNYVERLRDRIRELAFDGETRLLEKEGMVHLPEWAVLRQKTVDINVHAILEQQLKILPTELLKRVLDVLENGGEIEAEDAEIFELPPAGESDQEDVDNGDDS